MSGNGKGRGAPDTVRSVCKSNRFDEALRSARSLSGSPLAGGALNALPEAPPTDRSRSIGIPGPPAYPPQACLLSPTLAVLPFLSSMPGKAEDREVALAPTHASPGADERFPLDRPPTPHRSLAMRPFHATRWDEYAGGLRG